MKQTVLHNPIHIARRPHAHARSKVGGFTLLELLVVLAILGLIAGLIGPQVMKHLGGAKTKTARLQIEELSVALDMYSLETGSYPSSQEGLAALIERPRELPGWNGPYLKKKRVPQDPWNRDYLYRSPGQHGDYDLYSYGADGKQGGQKQDADINNWE